ncbi:MULTISPECIES: DUF6074 family protein [Pseudorhizobium]|jgi:hypothetical protein|uniref:DUF6074 family protein n=1 Tax=Pseudorhizobium TaxID=1903858 RepID=UPI00097C92EE|nr:MULTISPECIES: DUF6074 family protein [Pseudorhizobium]MBA4785459.1 hypothetical protein [Hyphomicrobiales bacterium]MBU1313777.1 hypothetical protein [Alphaproteobacteria bacterium]MDY6961026.1 DUF6074 family protein [Pseudomonadota bacterium]MBU1552823.1 hypothetical protein [Alphaproteobacteria bacterium]MBU2334639.1 hypothetical protein [Alphaproteobacteria bacterium]|tara:strand:- start:1673 stop:1915 length:243 start_codon:yes stop_codon:yes gene_type:complete
MTLVQFPTHRRSGDIRRCALILRDLHGNEANCFWREEMKKLAASLRRIGVDEAQISEQARQFMDAVQMELQSFHASESAG